MLNSDFSSVFSQRRDYDPPEKCEEQMEETGLQFEMDEHVVKEHLIILSKFKSPGLDELHSKLLKELVEELSEPLSIVLLKLRRWVSAG